MNYNVYSLRMQAIPQSKREKKEEKSEEIIAEETKETKPTETLRGEEITLNAEDALAIVNKATVKGVLTSNKVTGKGGTVGGVESLIDNWNNLTDNATYEEKLSILNQIIDLLSGNEDEVRPWICKRLMLVAENKHQMVTEILSDENIDWETFDFTEFYRNFCSNFNVSDFYNLNAYYRTELDNIQSLYEGHTYEEQLAIYEEFNTFLNAGLEYYSAWFECYQILQNNPGAQSNYYNNMQSVQNGINIFSDLLEEGIPEPEEPSAPEPPAIPEPPEPDPEPGTGNELTIEELINLWQTTSENPDYEYEIDILTQIINSLENNGQDASIWRLRRYIAVHYLNTQETHGYMENGDPKVKPGRPYVPNDGFYNDLSGDTTVYLQYSHMYYHEGGINNNELRSAFLEAQLARNARWLASNLADIKDGQNNSNTHGLARSCAIVTFSAFVQLANNTTTSWNTAFNGFKTSFESFKNGIENGTLNETEIVGLLSGLNNHIQNLLNNNFSELYCTMLKDCVNSYLAYANIESNYWLV